MQKINLVIALMSFVFVATSCNTKQDPLAGQSDKIVNGTPDDGPIKKQEPIDKNAVRIDSPALVNIQAGDPSTFNVVGRVLVPGVTFTLSAANLKDFPGAVFNAATGDFSWTPKEDFLLGERSRTLNLVLSLTINPGTTGLPISVETKETAINVFASYEVPVISSLSTSSIYNVGSSYNLDLEILDQDAATNKDFTLVFKDCALGSAAFTSNLISYNPDNFIKNFFTGKFKGFITLNLANRVFPYDNSQYCFSTWVYSKYGLSSKSNEVRFRINNPLKPSAVTQNVFSVKQGQIATYSFSFFDPLQIANLNAKSATDPATLLPGSTLTNTTFGTPGIINYTLKIDATKATIGKYNLNFTITSSYGNSSPVDTNHTLIMDVN